MTHLPFDLRPLEASPAGPILAFLATCEPSVALVGGCVRDLMLDRPTHDLDLTVERGGLDLARALANRFDGAFYAMDVERDTGRALLPMAGQEPLVVDVAAWRGASLAEDLHLRDFTINAMVVVLRQSGHEFVDPLDGVRDLKNGLIRTAAPSAFRDDPLRVLRAIRMLAELAPLGFRLEEDSERQAAQFAPLLAQVSIERVRDELVKILAAAAPGDWVAKLDDLSILDIVLPEATALHGVSQSPPHIWDVFDHTTHVINHAHDLVAWISGDDTALAVSSLPWVADSIEQTLGRWRAELAALLAQGAGAQLRTHGQMLAWAALSHDWGKPATARFDHDDEKPDRWHFFGHPDVGADMAYEALRRLRFNEAEARRVSLIVRHHMRPLLLAVTGLPSRRATHRFYRDLGDAGVDVALLSLADMQGTYGSTLTPDDWQPVLDTVASLLDSYFDARDQVIAPPALINGHELMAALDLPGGKHIGQLLEAIAEAQAGGDVKTREQALVLAGQLSAQQRAAALQG